MTTAITYDRDFPMLSVSPSTWTATPYTRWFDNYHIISSIDNPLADHLRVIDVRKYAGNAKEPLNTVKNIFASEALTRLEAELGLLDHFYIMNRAGSGRMGAHRKKLTNDVSVVSRFENKVWFREKFGNILRFAPSVFIEYKKLRGYSYEALSHEMSGDLVLQHPSLAGGRGTYIARSEAEYQYAVSCLLEADQTNSDPVVVSQYLEQAVERTMQGCVTSTDILIGPPQGQLVRHPELVSGRPGDIQFCGGRITDGLVVESQLRTMKSAMEVVGAALQDTGYKGVFGMDFLIHGDEVFVLEANPRMTGLSPLLADLQNARPFLLLHALEIAQQEYAMAAESHIEDETEGSFIQIYAQKDCRVTATTGIYDINLNKFGLGFEQGKLIPRNSNQFFIGLRVDPRTPIDKGKSIAFIYSRRQLFDDCGNLTPEALRITRKFRNEFIE